MRNPRPNALPLACALECIHTYSLVHDDLPSMDDDDFRRGRPTCHKVFGDGIAILAGDALLTIAFEIVSNAKPTSRYDTSILLREIAVAAGSQRLIAGQVADLEAEGKNVKRDQLQFIHENKTAAILKSSVRLGAMSANADARKLSAVTRFGQRLGLAFQIIDDILDVTQTSEILGKSAGKDIAAKKATYPAVIVRRTKRYRCCAAAMLNRCTHWQIIFWSASTDCSRRPVGDAAREWRSQFCRRFAQGNGYRTSARFGSISSVTLDSNPAFSRSNAANAIMGALSVHNHGSALLNSNPLRLHASRNCRRSS